MPELPEVETVVRHIRPLFEGKAIKKVTFPNGYTRVIATGSHRGFNKAVSTQTITGVSRRAKLIVLELEQGLVTIHLRMTGRLIDEMSPEDKKYVSASFHLSDDSQVYFKDVRKFGRISYHQSPEELEDKYGYEPLSRDFTSEALAKLLGESSRMIKPFLLDQSKIAGLGNIYVDECLWRSRIHPEYSTNRVSRKKTDLLHKAIRDVLKASIKANGTTFQSFYYGEDSMGEFKNCLDVFGRDGEPCPSCSTVIKKIRVSQRGTHYCPKCQRN